MPQHRAGLQGVPGGGVGRGVPGRSPSGTHGPMCGKDLLKDPAGSGMLSYTGVLSCYIYSL